MECKDRGWRRTFIVVLALLCSIVGVLAAPPDNDTINISILINTPPNITSIDLDDNAPGGDDTIDLIASANQTAYCTFNVTDVDEADSIDQSQLNVTIISIVTGYTGIEDVKYEFHLNWNDTSSVDACLNQSTGSNSPSLGGWIYYNCSIAMPHFAENGTWTCLAKVYDNMTGEGNASDTASVSQLVALNISREIISFDSVGLGQNTTSQDYNTTIENIGNVPIRVEMTAHSNISQPSNDTYAMSCAAGQINESDILFDDDGTFTADIGDEGNWTYLNGTGGLGNVVAAADMNLQEAQNFSMQADHTIYWGINLQKSIELNPQGQCTGFLLFNAIVAT